MTEGGLEFDRQWMVMQGNKVLTQKRDPLLSQIRTCLDMERKILTLSYRCFSHAHTFFNDALKCCTI